MAQIFYHDSLTVAKASVFFTHSIMKNGSEYIPPTPLNETETLSLSDEILIDKAKLVNSNENLSLNDTHLEEVFYHPQEQLGISDEFKVHREQILSDSFGISDELIVKSASALDLNENLSLSETLELHKDDSLVLNESVSLADSIYVNILHEFYEGLETLGITDSISILEIKPVKYATKIISYNPLLIVTYTDPVQLVQVDLTDPENPTYISTHINASAETVAYAKDIIYNSTFECLYIACADGKLLKVDINDFGIREEIDLVDTNDLLKLTQIDSFHKIFSSTDDSNGELILLDNAELSKISLDFRTIVQVNNTCDISFNTLSAEKLNLDFRFLEQVKNTVSLDFRFLNESYNRAQLNPIARTDFVVKIDGVSVTDVRLDSIRIFHSISEQSQAEFVLARKHDNLNYTEQGVYQQITNNNTVEIYIQNNLEFSGKISELQCDSNNETVSIQALGDCKISDRKQVNLPLPSLNEKLHPYQVILNNPQIYNPVVDTRYIIISSNNRYWSSSNTWDVWKENAMIFSSIVLAQAYIDNMTDNYENNPENDSYKYFVNHNPSVLNYEENPKIYKGIRVYLGEKITQNYIKLSTINGSQNAEDLENGDFKPKQNWQYFYTSVNATNFTSGKKKTYFYVGTSMAPFSADSWLLESFQYKRQRKMENKIEDLGYYYLGEAPFKDINTKNGQFIAKDYYEDKSNGLYRTTDEQYDYVDYAKKVAELEYEKLKTINNQIAPVTSCSAMLMLDGYYFYDLNLLTRTNIVNTITSDIYKNTNGFPVSIKTIEITSSDMMVRLGMDNKLSEEELKEIEAQFPDEESEEYKQEAESNLIYLKSDPVSDSTVE